MPTWLARFLCRLDGHITERIGGRWYCLRCGLYWQIVTDGSVPMTLGPNSPAIWLDPTRKP